MPAVGDCFGKSAYLGLGFLSVLMEDGLCIFVFNWSVDFSCAFCVQFYLYTTWRALRSRSLCL